MTKYRGTSSGRVGESEEDRENENEREGCGFGAGGVGGEDSVYRTGPIVQGDEPRECECRS